MVVAKCSVNLAYVEWFCHSGSSTGDARRTPNSMGFAFRRARILKFPFVWCTMIRGTGFNPKSSILTGKRSTLYGFSWVIHSISAVRRLYIHTITNCTGLRVKKKVFQRHTSETFFQRSEETTPFLLPYFEEYTPFNCKQGDRCVHHLSFLRDATSGDVVWRFL